MKERIGFCMFLGVLVIFGTIVSVVPDMPARYVPSWAYQFVLNFTLALTGVILVFSISDSPMPWSFRLRLRLWTGVILVTCFLFGPLPWQLTGLLIAFGSALLMVFALSQEYERVYVPSPRAYH